VLQKKVCILGAFGVGKTSLTRRFVESIFSDVYLTTVGVKVDKKTMSVGERDVTLVLWDIAGEDEANPVRMTYARGAAAYVLVADGTRAETLDVARSIHDRMVQEIGRLPFLLLLNKADLEHDWELGGDAVDALERSGWVVLRASAKTGTGVDEAFQHLAERLVPSSC
jgi:small GTP-binding protein